MTKETSGTYEAFKANQDAVTRQAAEKGLKIFFTANTGLVRGSSWDIVITVYGNTYPVKESLKAHGAIWSARAKCWVFKEESDFTAALATI